MHKSYLEFGYHVEDLLFKGLTIESVGGKLLLCCTRNIYSVIYILIKVVSFSVFVFRLYVTMIIVNIHIIIWKASTWVIEQTRLYLFYNYDLCKSFNQHIKNILWMLYEYLWSTGAFNSVCWVINTYLLDEEKLYFPHVTNKYVYKYICIIFISPVINCNT